MNKAQFLKTFEAAILELEKAEKLVVTTPVTTKISEHLYSSIRDQWCREVEGLDSPPPELRIESSLEQAIDKLVKTFDLDKEEANSIAYDFYKYCAEFKSELDIADYFSHEGPFEISLTAYFCIKLGKDRFGSSDYLEWRKLIYREIKDKKSK